MIDAVHVVYGPSSGGGGPVRARARARLSPWPPPRRSADEHGAPRATVCWTETHTYTLFRYTSLGGRRRRTTRC